MGMYYQVACDKYQERINPGDINNLGNKSDAIAHLEHPFGSVVVFAMLHRWECVPVRLVDDLEDDDGYFAYDNVTEEVLEAYNEFYCTDLKFTGEDDDE